MKAEKFCLPWMTSTPFLRGTMEICPGFAFNSQIACKLRSWNTNCGCNLWIIIWLEVFFCCLLSKESGLLEKIGGILETIWFTAQIFMILTTNMIFSWKILYFNVRIYIVWKLKFNVEVKISYMNLSTSAHRTFAWKTMSK